MSILYFKQQSRFACSISLGQLDPAHRDEFKAHLLRLPGARRSFRFGSKVSDTFLRSYADRIDFHSCVIFVARVCGVVRGAAELISLTPTWQSDCEIAFTVEEHWEKLGLDRILVESAIKEASRRKVGLIHVMCCSKDPQCLRLLADTGAQLEAGAFGVSGQFGLSSVDHEELGGSPYDVLQMFTFTLHANP
jgi:hypothetical protein